MKQIIKKIKEKKELSDLPDSLIEDTLKNYFKKYNLSMPSTKKSQKILIKEIRSELRKYTGRFQVSSKKRTELLKENKVRELLKTHTSTKERLPYYSKLISLIKKYDPKSILDLGCGLNPIAVAKKFPTAKYYAYDIKESELKLISHFFRENKIPGKTKVIDIRKLTKLPKTDLTLILKTLDIIETKGHPHATNIMKNLNSKNIIVSFSTKTLSGKPMNSPRRQWFENLLHSQRLEFKIFRIPNEVFYIISKNSN